MQVFYRYKALLEKHIDELAALVTEFQRTVWMTLAGIGYGETISRIGELTVEKWEVFTVGAT